jgi:hypothetical protein
LSPKQRIDPNGRTLIETKELLGSLFMWDMLQHAANERESTRMRSEKVPAPEQARRAATVRERTARGNCRDEERKSRESTQMTPTIRVH